MAFIQYLAFDGENLPLPDSYEVNLEDKEADSGGETEAGTIQRDVVRAGVVDGELYIEGVLICRGKRMNFVV